MIFYKNDMFEKIIFFEYCVFISNVVILHSRKCNLLFRYNQFINFKEKR